MMHQYSQTDTKRCLRYLAFWGHPNHFVFIGDSRIRQLYLAFVNHLDSREGISITPAPERHSDFSYGDSKLRLRVEFIWSPYISRQMIDDFRRWKDSDEPPNVIVAGSATWSIKESNASALALLEYSSNLTHLVRAINVVTEKKSRVLWTLQEPVNKEKLLPGRQMITNEQIDLYNKAAMEVIFQIPPSVKTQQLL